MTGAIGGGAVNLATLWVPVLPEVSGFAGALAEGVVGGATAAVVNKFLGVMGEMVTKAVEGLSEVAKGVLEIGETFQTLEYQVESYTNAQGTQLDNLKDSAAKVFATLDTGVKNLGENFDVLHQRLGIVGPDLEKMTHDFAELTDRLGNLDVRAFTAVLDAYGVNGANADAALRTLAGDTQQYGDTLANLTASMQTANPIFDQLGIGFNSGAEAMAKIDALGPNAMKVMNGLASAGKEFAKLPSGTEDFKKFIGDSIEAINYYTSHNEEGKAQQLSATFFGTRQWAIVLRSLQPILDAMNGIGKAGNEINVDKFVQDTETLDRMWTLFIHKLEFDLKPVGDAALLGLETGVKWLGDFLAAHEGEIVGKIKGWGDGFIQALPGIQRFVGEGIRLLGMFFEFMNTGTQAVVSNISLIMQAWGWLTDNPKDIKMGQGLMDMANQLNKIDISKFTDGIANLIEDPNIDTAKIQQKWDDAMAQVLGHADKSQGGVGTGLSVSIDPIAPDGTALTDPKQLIPGVPSDGLHLPVTLDPSNANNNTPDPKTMNDQLPWFLNPGKILNPDWDLGHIMDALTPTAGADASALNLGPRAPGTAGPPGVAHTGDPNDPVHVAVVLSAFSAPLDGNITQVPGGGWGKGGGGPSHAANKGYGSTGPGAPSGSGYDAPTDPRNQMPSSKKTKTEDPGDLVGPLMDALGLGNVLGGTNPENWGIVKFAKSMMAFLNGDAGTGGGAGGVPGASGGSGPSSNTSWLLNALGMGHLNPGGSTGPGPGGPDDGSGGPTPPDGSGPNFSAGPKGPWMGSGTGHYVNPGLPPVPATSYDNGGTLIPGDTTATNRTGKPEAVLPPGAAFLPANPTTAQGAQLMAALKSQGFTDSEITGLVALNNVETGNWSHPESIMGLTDNQTGPGVQAHVDGFKKMWDARQASKAVPTLGQPGTGVDAKGNVTDPKQYADWLLKTEGYSATTDWQGNKYAPGQFLSPQDYANQVSGAYVPGATPGTPGAAPGASNPALNALKSWFGGGTPPGSGTPGFNPLTFGLGLPPGAAGPGAVYGAYPAGIGPFNYGGIAADTGSTATPGAIASTANPQFGGIPKAASGKDQEILNFMQGQMNAFNQRTGSHLSVSADYPGGPHGHPDDGADHSVRRAMDISGSQKDMDAFAAYWFNNPALRAATRQLIHDPELDKDPRNPFTGDMNIIGGKATSGPQTYAGAPYGPGPSGPGHTDHDHIAMQYIPDMNPPNVSAGPNVSPQAAKSAFSGAKGSGDTHIHGDYMPLHVAPSAIDPKPAVTAMQDHQNSMVGRAGGFGGLPA